MWLPLLSSVAAVQLTAPLETLRLGHGRSCLFRAPPDDAPAPLVVVLHGYNVDPRATLDFYFSDVKRLAEERGG